MSKSDLYTQLEENRQSILEKIAQAASRSGRDSAEVSLIAVSKKQEASKMQAYIDVCSGANEIPIFGENYVQDYLAKKNELKGSFRSHFIGLLQSNKAKIAVENFDLIESCHSEKLLLKINEAAQKLQKIQDIYLQVNISEDDAKGGFSANTIFSVLETVLPRLEHIRVCGLMTITRYYENPELVRPDFKCMYEVYKEFESRILSQSIATSDTLALSMGMSSDFPIAVEEGATVVRVGTRLFGARA